MLSSTRDEFDASGSQLGLGAVLRDYFTDKRADNNIEVLAARIGQIVRLGTMRGNQSGMHLTIKRSSRTEAE